jgi:CHAT domain-containing protein/predicted negative regulator of RcsB-dependent stress response
VLDKQVPVRERPTLIAAGLLAALAGWSGCRSSPQPEKLIAEAEELRLKYDKAASQQAIAKYRIAMVAWKRTGDKRSAAWAGQRIGATYEQLGSLRESLTSYLEALPLAQASGDRLLESEIRSDAGTAQAAAADREEVYEEARTQCQGALELARQLEAHRAEAKALNCLGEVASSRQQPEQALAFYSEAGRLWDRVGDEEGRAQTLLYQGYAYADLTKFDQARMCYERARSLWASLGDRRKQAITLVADARLLGRQAEYQEAQNKFEAALALLKPMGDAVWEGGSLTGIATVYLQMGETSAALKYWERALQMFEAAGLKSVSVDVLGFLGETYLAAGDDARALSRFERALALANELGSQQWKAIVLRLIGVVHLVRHQPSVALQNLERSLAMQQSPGSPPDPRLKARTLADMGEAHDLLGEHQVAVTYFDEALALSRTSGDRVAEARALFGLARASIGLKDLNAARTHIERSLSVVESLRTEVESRDLRASYFASVQHYHQLHMGVLMQLHKERRRQGLAAAAFEASERARARSLLESLTEAEVDLRVGVDPDLLKREQMSKRGLADWAERRSRVTTAAAGETAAAAMAEEYRDLEERYNQVQAEIRSKSPRYAALARPRSLNLKEVQEQVLDAETLLLEYALGEERSYLWAVSNRDQASYELAPRAEIERAAQRVYERLTARLTVTGDQGDRRRRVEQADAEYWQEAGRLSEVLLGPVAKKMAGKRILVVADGALQYLPFAALPVPGGRDEPVPMVVEHEIVSLPSASVLAVLRRETAGRRQPAKTVAVLADPVFEPDDPRLSAASRAAGRSGNQAPKMGYSAEAPPAANQALNDFDVWRGGKLSFPRLAATRQEADAIVAMAAEGMTLRAIDFEAGRATAMSPELAQYRIVHFATHAVFDNDTPGLSAIVLSMFDERGQARDGFLRLHDIYGLQLPAELVVLSACNTALGKQVRGEGLVGIVRGFMYAGAKRVVASLWKVDDEATGEMMSRFYSEMLKHDRSPAAALRQAQLATWRQKRWQPPFYWAAFVLQGEWK